MRASRSRRRPSSPSLPLLGRGPDRGPAAYPGTRRWRESGRPVCSASPLSDHLHPDGCGQHDGGHDDRQHQSAPDSHVRPLIRVPHWVLPDESLQVRPQWMMKPVRLCRSGSSLTTCLPRFPHRMVTSALTSVKIPTTAGFTRSILASTTSPCRSKRRSPALVSFGTTSPAMSNAMTRAQSDPGRQRPDAPCPVAPGSGLSRWLITHGPRRFH